MTNTGAAAPAPLFGPIANADQAAAWNGPEGEHWAAHRRRADDPRAGLVEPLLEAAVIDADSRVLDIGCGDGAATVRAASAAPRGAALGVDLSSTMVGQARQRAAEARVTNARFIAADAQVHPFATAAFDVAVSHFGVMFFEDPVAAFANIRRALRPGGRLAFVCPNAAASCAWYQVPLAAMLGRPSSSADAPSAMFSLADPWLVIRVLRRAGLGAIALQSLDRSLWFGEDARTAASFFLGSGPGRAALERLDDAATAEARDRLVAALRPYEHADGVLLPGRHWLVTARRAVTPS
jgi:SAM-dependent methyltransferase